MNVSNLQQLVTSDVRVDIDGLHSTEEVQNQNQNQKAVKVAIERAGDD